MKKLELGKYRINEMPGYIRAPVVELIPGERGTISYVAMLEGDTSIFTSDGRVLEIDGNFADYDDDMLKCLNGKKIPIEELQTVRELAKKYSKSAI